MQNTILTAMPFRGYRLLLAGLIALLLLAQISVGHTVFTWEISSADNATPGLQESWPRLSSASAEIGYPGAPELAPRSVSCPLLNTSRLYVRQNTSGSTGIDWANALPTLQDALQLAHICTDITQIWVAAGVYYPDQGRGQTNNNRHATFILRNHLAIYGGFAGTETSLGQREWRAHPTILSGDIDQDNLLTGNSHHVVTGSDTDNSAILDGFTITAGNANGPGCPGTRCGGGIYNVNGSPKLANLFVRANAAALHGGGIYNYANSSPTLVNVSFSGNSAMYGSGMMNYSNSSPLLANVSFSGNRATVHGGGMLNYDNSSPLLTNVTFSGNRATVHGGGIYNESNSNPTIRNSLFWNNQSGNEVETAAAAMTVVNSTPTLQYSLLQGWNPGGTNLDGAHPANDPRFVTAVDPDTAPTNAGDLRLQASSPAIDRGNSSYVSGLLTDLDGNPRITGNSVDLGAYEAQIVIIALSADPADAGTVSGGGPIFPGEMVTVTASANTHYTFANWTENGTVVSTDGEYSFEATADRTLVANFTLDSGAVAIKLSANPAAGGQVSGGGAVITGETVTVTASAKIGYTFANWTENGTVISTEMSFSFAATENRTLVANFTLNSYTIAVSANPTAGGTANGSGVISYGELVTVTAIASPGYSFANWTESGTVVFTNPEYSFTVEGDRTLVANFTLNQYAIAASANPAEGGTVSGDGTVTHGDIVTVTAVANTGYTFVRWTEGGAELSTSASYSFTAEQDRTLVANFSAEEHQIYLPLLTH
jgi:uncharacterized repeat protein (TIGR02543 family)